MPEPGGLTAISKMMGIITMILAVLVAATALSGCTTVNTNLLPATTATPRPSSGDGTGQEPAGPSATAQPSSAMPTALSPSATARPSSAATPSATISASVTPTPTPTAVPDDTVILNITGNVKNPMKLTASDLAKYPQVSIINHTYLRSGGRVYQMTATGASLNAILDVAQPTSDMNTITFLGSDDFSVSVTIQYQIRTDPLSMISLNWSNTENYNDITGEKCSNFNEGLRVILPRQTYGQYNAYYL